MVALIKMDKKRIIMTIMLCIYVTVCSISIYLIFKYVPLNWLNGLVVILQISLMVIGGAIVFRDKE